MFCILDLRIYIMTDVKITPEWSVNDSEREKKMYWNIHLQGLITKYQDQFSTVSRIKLNMGRETLHIQHTGTGVIALPINMLFFETIYLIRSFPPNLFPRIGIC